jgi:putative ABC transport system permease protein
MSRRDDDLNEELQAHLRMAIDERVARGESRASAERAARREFGNVTHVGEVTREVRGLWFERVIQDLAYGARALRRTPGFTIVAVLTLSLAIGANSAVFTVVNSVLLRPLPFREPEQLHMVSYIPSGPLFQMPPGLADSFWLEYRKAARVFEQVTAYRRTQTTLSGVGDATRLNGALVDAAFLGTLGVAPALGRGFTRDEETPGRDRVAILGAPLWRERFAADPGVIGRSITLDGEPHTIVGVMPDGFSYPANSVLWRPLAIRRSPGNSFIIPVLGRLPRGATLEQARSELDAIARALPANPRNQQRTEVARVQPLKELMTSRVQTSLWVFLGAVSFVLLIACANVANLLLIRAAGRRREMAVRVALGAGRMRIARQLLTESVLIGVLGGAIGMVIAVAGVRALLSIAPQGRIPRLDEVHVDGWVLAFTIVVSIVTGIVFGLVPALASSRRAPSEALANGARVMGGTHNRMRSVLVTAEMALALVLLTGAGLMIKSFIRMRSVDTGFDGTQLTTLTVNLPSASYPDVARLRAFHDDMRTRLAAIPGVQAVGAVASKPLSGAGMSGDFVPSAPTPLPNGYIVDKTAVSPGYFDTMGIKLIGGRDFSSSDVAGTPGVVVISETVARRVWPGEDAVGKQLSMANTPGPGDWLTVIGVVRDVVQNDFAKHSTIYQSYHQLDRTFFMEFMTYVVRANMGTSAIAPAMRAALSGADPRIPAQALQTMDQAMLDAAADPLFQTRLLAVFSFLAVLLAAIGTYGVLAYDVAERTREIGVRMALGATPGDVMRMVMRRTAVLALSGAAIGVVGSLGLTGVLTQSLFEVKPNDPMTMAIVTAAIVSVALMAGFIPARRATRTPALTSLADS